MKPMVPENFDGGTAADRLDPTWKAQVDLESGKSTRLPGLGLLLCSFVWWDWL